MSNKKAASAAAPPPQRRGRQKRKEHWLYDVETALGLNHSDIARLLTPEPLSTDAVWDIVNERFDTPALNGLRFPVSARVVTDILTGESLIWAEKAEALLSKRLGFSLEVDVEGKKTPRVYEPVHRDEVPFNVDWVNEYLGDWEQQMRYEHMRPGSPFVAMSPPIPIPPSNIFRSKGAGTRPEKR